ncbi:37S ribosomal protein S23, mitochondrial [Candida viswanathii]|uniref:Small ribosomal subunit protein mS29 n=1 Tax=Candida viswanathii TaxID=5486 RepID=A0A367XVU8_9ASCO|nr:37S ribosomal protein S23, mitochondrial [Candida viswanathii]
MLRARVAPTFSFTRTLTSTPVVAAAVRQKDGKKKQVMRKKIDPNAVKVVKTTALTHLPFVEAVRNLGLEKNAPASNTSELSFAELKSGKITSYPADIEAKLKIVGGFRRHQHHEMYDKPISMVTTNTERLTGFIDKLNEPSKDNRVYLDGIKGCGKSTLLNQAITLANEKFNGDIIVMHLDAGESVANGTSDYIKNNKLKMYQQPMLTKRWIWKILKTNEKIFKKHQIEMKAGKNTLFEYLKQNHEFGKPLPHSSFQFFIEELVAHSKDIPVLLSIDNFNAFADTTLTKYRHPDFTLIPVAEFEVGDFILKVASGDLSFTKGGALFAKSNNFSEKKKTTQVAIYPEEPYDPYMKLPQFDFEIANRLTRHGGIKPFKVDPLTKDEVKSLMTFWRQQGVLLVRQDFHKKIFDEEVAAKILQVDPDSQFEKLVESSYIMNQGNPHMMVKQAMMSY